MNNTATATAKETVRRPAPAAPSSAGRMTRRVGNTTYRVTLHFKENGKEKDPLAWVAHQNSLTAMAEEIVLRELVYN